MSLILSRCRLEELQALFQSVQQEIEERDAFVQQLQACRRPKEYYAHVRLEIATRLKELERLDMLIQREAQGSQ
jgi:site-specific DNA-adenine methylase